MIKIWCWLLWFMLRIKSSKSYFKNRYWLSFENIIIYQYNWFFLHNCFIVYWILLTIPVTAASAERSFSKLKLIKNYLRSAMSQETLNGLAILSIENELLKDIEYKNLIIDFPSKKARAIFK